jgi:hypothetical protein
VRKKREIEEERESKWIGLTSGDSFDRERERMGHTLWGKNTVFQNQKPVIA